MIRQTVGSLVRWTGIQLLLLQERRASGIAFNPLTRRVRDDPYPAYRTLRARNPVHESRLLRAWLLTRYDDCAALLRDPRLSAVRSLAFGGAQTDRSLD